MAYVNPNFRTKKELKEQLRINLELERLHALSIVEQLAAMEVNGLQGKRIRYIDVYQPGIGTIPANGKVYLEGPHYPEPHKWYAEGTMKDGILVSIK